MNSEWNAVRRFLALAAYDALLTGVATFFMTFGAAQLALGGPEVLISLYSAVGMAILAFINALRPAVLKAREKAEKEAFERRWGKRPGGPGSAPASSGEAVRDEPPLIVDENGWIRWPVVGFCPEALKLRSEKG